MDIFNYVERRGLKEVSNPLYNPNKKKQNQPKTVLVTDLGFGDDDSVINTANKYFENEEWVDSKTADKYRPYGINYNAREAATGDLDRELARKQSNWAKAWNGIMMQGVVGEVVIGSVKGLSDIVDAFLSGVGLKEANYTNPVSETLGNWKDYIEEKNPIYGDPDKQSLADGGLTDFGYLMSNMPSVLSTLSLMIPGKAVSGTLGALSKAAKLDKLARYTAKTVTGINKADRLAKLAKEGERLSKMEQLFVKGSQFLNDRSTIANVNRAIEAGVSGTAMRIAENYQEAQQAYEDAQNNALEELSRKSPEQYANWISTYGNRLTEAGYDGDLNDKQQVAKFIAKQAADRTFSFDMINALSDAYQMFTLPNTLKGFMNLPSRAAVRAAQRNSLKFSNAQKLEEAIAKRSFTQKSFDKLFGAITGDTKAVLAKPTDLLFGAKHAIFSEVGEGLEEAVNYIAQEEGNNYGRYLLGTADENSTFDERFSQYVRNPQLWESAFWGFAGGILFEEFGGRINQVASNARDMTNAAIQRHNSTPLGKDEDTKVDYFDVFTNNELTTRLNDIRSRMPAKDRLISQLKAIGDDGTEGTNPFVSAEAPDAAKKVTSNEEKAILRNRAFNDFNAELLKNSMFAGNYDLTKMFITSDEFKQALIEQGGLTEQEAETRRREALATANKIERLYSENMRAIANAARGIDAQTHASWDDLTYDYMRIIAANNIDNQLLADRYQQEIETYEPIKNSEEERLADKLRESGINYQDAVRTYTLAQQLGQIEAEIEDLESSAGGTLTGQMSLDYLKKRREVIRGLLNQSSTGNELDQTAFSLLAAQAAAMTVIDKETHQPILDMNSKRYQELDNLILNATSEEVGDVVNEDSLKKLKEQFPFLENIKTVTDFRDLVHHTKATNEALTSVFGTNEEDSPLVTLRDMSEVLLKTYAARSYAEINRAEALYNIATTKSDIIREVNTLHNNMKKTVRYAMNEGGLNTLKRIAKKYNDAFKATYAGQEYTLGDLLIDYGLRADDDNFSAEAQHILPNLLSDEDMRLLESTLDDFNLVHINNKGLYNNLWRALRVSDSNNYEDIIEPEEKQESDAETEDTKEEESSDTHDDKTEKKEEKSSSAPQKRKSEQKKAKPSTTSQTPPKSSSEPAGQQIAPFSMTKRQNGRPARPLMKPMANIIISDGKPVALDNIDIDDDTLPAVAVNVNPDAKEQVELDFKTQVDSEARDATAEDSLVIATLGNEELFDRKGTGTLLAKNVTVEKNPVVYLASDGKTILSIDKGLVRTTDDTSSDNGAETTPPPVTETSDSGTDNGTISSTGGRSAASASDVDEDDNPDIGINYDLDTLLDDVVSEANRMYEENPDVSNDDAIAAFNAYLKEKYPDAELTETDEAVVNAELLSELEHYRPKDDSKNKRNRNREARKAIDDAIRSSAILDSQISDKKETAAEQLSDSFNKILDLYLKDIPLDESGTRVISLEGLMRYIKDVTDDIRLASYLYDKFVDHIKQSNKSRTGNKYRILEYNTSRSEVISNAAKSIAERITEISDPNGRSIGLNVTLNGKTEEELEAIYKVLDSAKPNNKLKTEQIIDKDGRITAVAFTLKGVEIGRIAVPTVQPNGVLRHYTNGWIVDMPTDDSGMCPLHKFYIEFLRDKRTIPILNLIREAAITKKKIKDEFTEEYKRLCEQIITETRKLYPNIDTELISHARDKEGKEYHTDAEFGHGMVQVLQYIHRIDATASRVGYDTDAEFREAHAKAREASVNNWFGKLRNSLETAVLLVSGKHEVRIEDITGNATPAKSREPRPIQEKGVIGKSHKGKLELAVADITQSGIIFASNGERITSPGTYGGRTFIGIPTHNGKLMFVNAHPQPISSDNFKNNKDIQRLKHEILEEIESQFVDWFNNKNISSDGLFHFLSTLVSRANHNENLFKGFEVKKMTKGFNGFTLRYQGEDGIQHSIKFFDSAHGYVVSNVQIDGDRGINAVKNNESLTKANQDRVISSITDMINTCMVFNIQPDFIQSDTNGASVFTNDTVYRDEDGNFCIKIGDNKPHVYKSYKDFIIGSNAINVETESQDGRTNFMRRHANDDQYDSTHITYKIIQSNPPVGESVDNPQVEAQQETVPTATVPANITEQAIRTIISQNTNGDVGIEIVKQLLNSTQLVTLSNSSLLKHLPLDNIMVIDDIPDIARHYSNDSEFNGTKIPEGTIVIGRRFFDLANSDNAADREEAFRHLVHEGIHRHIHFNINSQKRTELFSNIREIFNTFVSANNNDGLKGGIRIFEFNTTPEHQARYYKDGEITDLGLEEFLVESITRPVLMQRLNEISADGKLVTNRKNKVNIKSKNLFQKILSVIADLFGINVNKNSLLEKEYNLFKKVLSDANTSGKRESATSATSKQVDNLQLSIDFDANPTTETEPAPTINITSYQKPEETQSSSDDDVDNLDIDSVFSAIKDSEIYDIQSFRNRLRPENVNKFNKLINNGDIELTCKL